ncbi:hypothetical protein FOZ63_003035, partial [Perkinsus olseni]
MSGREVDYGYGGGGGGNSNNDEGSSSRNRHTRRRRRHHQKMLKRFLDDEASESDDDDDGYYDHKVHKRKLNKKENDGDDYHNDEDDDDDDKSSSSSEVVSELMADVEEENELRKRLLEDSEKLADFHADWEMKRDEELIRAVEGGKLFNTKRRRTRMEAAHNSSLEDAGNGYSYTNNASSNNRHLRMKRHKLEEMIRAAERDVAEELEKLHQQEYDDDDMDSMDLGSDLVVSEDDAGEESYDEDNRRGQQSEVKEMVIRRLKEAREKERINKRQEGERRKKAIEDVKSQLESGLSTLEDREQEQYIRIRTTRRASVGNVKSCMFPTARREEDQEKQQHQEEELPSPPTNGACAPYEATDDLHKGMHAATHDAATLQQPTVVNSNSIVDHGHFLVNDCLIMNSRSSCHGDDDDDDDDDDDADK